MFLSRLVLNTRVRAVRLDLANPYDLHRTLTRAVAAGVAEGHERLLWRVEVEAASQQPFVLAQSLTEPDWGLLRDRDPGYLLDAQHKQVRPGVSEGQVLAFRLRANPAVKRDGRRFAIVGADDQVGWLARKGAQHGFQLVEVAVRGERLLQARKEEQTISVSAVVFEGTLRVVSAEQVVVAIERGIGPAKGLGFGLLSLARL